MAILDVTQLSFSYPGSDCRALDNVSLSVEKEEILFLLGINGSGKTTLLQHLNGLLQPVSGHVSFHGIPLGQYREKERFRRIGLVFQDPNDQLFAPTVGEDVVYGPRNLGLTEGDARERAREALEMVGLAGFEARQVRTLSYGQKKRAALAGILAMRPEVILMDEPTAGIDPVGAVQIMKLVQSLRDKKKLTVVVTTHDVDLAAVFAHRVCLLANGRISSAGPAGDVLGSAAALRKAGLRLPRMAHLAEILCTEDGMKAESLPLTIGQARRWLKKQCGKEDGGEHASNL